MLQHPFMIGFHQSFQDDYNLYLVMDYVPVRVLVCVRACVSVWLTHLPKGRRVVCSYPRL